MSGVWSVYDPSTGHFTGLQLSGPEGTVELNVPAGFGAVPGVYDRRRCRLDLETRAVVPHELAAEPLDDRWLAAAARRERDRLLSSSDWVVTKAYETGVPVPSSWAQYRKELRDVTLQPGFPRNVVWPEPPPERPLRGST
jgi:hypothetical protein